MQNKVLFPKRIIRKIGFSAASIALGAILWANVTQTTAEANPCFPGTDKWPGCLKEEKINANKLAQVITIQDIRSAK